MCGLSVVLRDGTIPEMVRMNQAMAHRGLTDIATKYQDTVVGHVRLPIVGLDAKYGSPFEYMGWVFLFVGEIVNFRDFDPKAECDIQVLAQAWAIEGPECVRRFDGFWSFVCFRRESPGIVYVVTDFLGKKPLYIRTDRLAISSEIHPLTLLGPVPVDGVYMSAVRKWGYHAGERTWAGNVTKIPPGTIAVITRDEGITEWEAGFDEVRPDASIDLPRAIEAAVKNRVMSSDVPIAMLLSGGLDSSIVYRLAAGLRSDMAIYYAENDEFEYLDMLLTRTHEVQRVKIDEYPLDVVLKANEGPVDLGSMMAQYSLGQSVREHVALSGDGADELFGGYRRSLTYDSQMSDVWEELPHYHLPRLDKLMMRGTVELRSPFLARDVVAGAMALPRSERTGKKFLKDAFGGLLPSGILDRSKAPLRSPQVREDAVGWRFHLCDIWERIAHERSYSTGYRAP